MKTNDETLERAVDALAKIREQGHAASLDDLKGVPVWLWGAVDEARTATPAEAVRILAEAEPPVVAPADEPLEDTEQEEADRDRLLDMMVGKTIPPLGGN